MGLFFKTVVYKLSSNHNTLFFLHDYQQPIGTLGGDLHSVYLFMTGTLLPENGIALPDMTRRADQGKFNQIDLDSNKF